MIWGSWLWASPCLGSTMPGIEYPIMLLPDCPFPFHRHTCSHSCPSQTARSSPLIPPYLWRMLQRTMPGN